MWILSVLRQEKRFWQTVQGIVLAPSAKWVRMWAVRVDFRVKALSQSVQVKGRSPVCVLICLVKSDCFLKNLITKNKMIMEEAIKKERKSYPHLNALWHWSHSFNPFEGFGCCCCVSKMAPSVWWHDPCWSWSGSSLYTRASGTVTISSFWSSSTWSSGASGGPHTWVCISLSRWNWWPHPRHLASLPLLLLLCLMNQKNLCYCTWDCCCCCSFVTKRRGRRQCRLPHSFPIFKK